MCIRKDYTGWSKKCWLTKYRCHGYYSPHARKWFYYYDKKELFVPIEHIDVLKPTPEDVVNQDNEDDPELPPGAVDVKPEGDNLDENPFASPRRGTRGGFPVTTNDDRVRPFRPAIQKLADRDRGN